MKSWLILTFFFFSFSLLAFQEDVINFEVADFPDDIFEILAPEMVQEAYQRHLRNCMDSEGNFTIDHFDNPEWEEAREAIDRVRGRGKSRKWLDEEAEVITDLERQVEIPRTLSCRPVQEQYYKFLLKKFENQNQDSKTTINSALQCLSRGWSIEDKIKFFREAEDPEALLGGKLSEVFDAQCLKKKKYSKAKWGFAGSCAQDVVCTIFGLVADGAIELLRLVKKDFPKCSSFQNTEAPGCASSSMHAVIDSFVSNLRGLKALADLAWDGVKSTAHGASSWVSSWWEDSSRLEDELTIKQLKVENGAWAFIKKLFDNPGLVLEEASKMIHAMGKHISTGIKDNYGCMRWKNPRHYPLDGKEPVCDLPFVSWDCATCGQVANMICGTTAFVGAEVVKLFFVGGYSGVIDALSQGGKIARGTSQVLALGALPLKSVAIAGRVSVDTIRLVASIPGRIPMQVLGGAGKYVLQVGHKTIPLRGSFGSMSNLVFNQVPKSARSLVAKSYNATLKKFFDFQERLLLFGEGSSKRLAYALLARKATRGQPIRDKDILRAEAIAKSSGGNFSSEIEAILLNQKKTVQLLKELDEMVVGRASRRLSSAERRSFQREFDNKVREVKQMNVERKVLIRNLEAESKNLKVGAKRSKIRHLKNKLGDGLSNLPLPLYQVDNIIKGGKLLPDEEIPQESGVIRRDDTDGASDVSFDGVLEIEVE